MNGGGVVIFPKHMIKVKEIKIPAIKNLLSDQVLELSLVEVCYRNLKFG